MSEEKEKTLEDVKNEKKKEKTRKVKTPKVKRAKKVKEQKPKKEIFSLLLSEHLVEVVFLMVQEIFVFSEVFL